MQEKEVEVCGEACGGSCGGACGEACGGDAPMVLANDHTYYKTCEQLKAENEVSEVYHYYVC
jgi:hypothetical protein